MDILVSLVLAVPVWVAGMVVFDGVHWALHQMLESRFALLRGLAWPHSVHHQWLDAELRIQPAFQSRNIWCHLVPEFLTQVVFTALLLFVLPLSIVLATLFFQTIAFGYLLSQRGLDVNHRPIEMLDAHVPSLWALPTYHAWHHVHPSAYFSAYLKVVDWVVGGSIFLGGKRVALQGSSSPFGEAMGRTLERAGVAELVPIETPDQDVLRSADILVVADLGDSEIPWVEAMAAARRTHQLPGEVWIARRGEPDAIARHYDRDVRIIYRTIAISEAVDPESAARWSLFCIRRGLSYIPARPSWTALQSFLRFRRMRPQRPVEAPKIRHRAELLA